MTGPDTAAGPVTRWCGRCERHVEPLKATPTSEFTEHGVVHTQREDCPDCLQRVHETVTGPGALAWAEAQGVEVTP